MFLTLAQTLFGIFLIRRAAKNLQWGREAVAGAWGVGTKSPALESFVSFGKNNLILGLL